MGRLRRLFHANRQPAVPSLHVGPITDWSQVSMRAPAWLFEPMGRATLDVVGESGYQGTLDQAAGGRTVDGTKDRDHIAVLVPEPSNPYDRQAVRVVIVPHGVIGYLSRENAVLYRPVIDRLAAIGKLTACRASLRGGWDRGGTDRGSIGVQLHLGRPEALMAELRAEGMLPEDAREVVSVVVPPAAVARDLGNLTGKTVCFTGGSACTVGGMPVSRATQEILAMNAGLHVLPRVTKKLDLLVVSPLADRTGKVVKAEQYAIPQVDEATFWRSIGVRID